jgi:hypothetical protein
MHIFCKRSKRTGYRAGTVSSPDVLAAVDAALREHFGQVPTRASVSFLGVEPIEVLRYEPIPGEWAYVTLGMSRRPMTAAADVMVSTDGPRAELMLHVAGPPGDHEGAWRQLAVLGAAPAVEGVVYTVGMTVDLGQPLTPGSRCTGGVILESAIPEIETGSGRVEVLQLHPATSTELAWCRVHGAAELRARWADQHIDLLDLGRRAATLT